LRKNKKKKKKKRVGSEVQMDGNGVGVRWVN